jgi:CBS domain-containing protein
MLTALVSQIQHTARWIEFLLGRGKVAENYVHASGRKVRDVMTEAMYTVEDEMPLSEVVDLMEKRRLSAFQSCATASGRHRHTRKVAVCIGRAATPLHSHLI